MTLFVLGVAVFLINGASTDNPADPSTAEDPPLMTVGPITPTNPFPDDSEVISMDDFPFIVNGITYLKISDENVSVTGCESNMTDVVIPFVVDGPSGATYNVVSIADNAFCGMTSLKALGLPESVLEIGNGALKGCDALRSLAVSIDAKFGEDSVTHLEITDLTLLKGDAKVHQDGFWSNWKDSVENLVVQVDVLYFPQLTGWNLKSFSMQVVY